MKRLALAAALSLSVASCVTPRPDIAVLDHCLFADEFDENRAAWSAIPAPEGASRLLALGGPGDSPWRLYWFRADDGRVSACQLHRYGSNFTIYSDATAAARVLDYGGVVLLVH